MSKVVRSVKNVTKGYSGVQIKVRNATSNDAWGPTGKEMAEIAQMTFNGNEDYFEIMDMLDKRLNDKGKNWKHVLKALKVLDYCLHEGSENCVTWGRQNLYVIRTLREFQHLDENGHDVGQNIRVAAKELTALLQDEDRLRAERKDRKSWKSRVNGLDEYRPQGSDHETPRRRAEPQRRRDTRQEDDNEIEFRLALEASKNEAEEDAKRRQSRDLNGADDADLAKAIKLSKEEEELRRRELEEGNTNNLFDLDAPSTTTTQQPQYTGWNQGYQQQGAVDWFGNPVGQQQPQSTGFLNNAYNQDFQAQQTGFNNPQTMNNSYNQQGFDQNQFQQQSFLQPQQTIQPQQTAFNTLNPYGQQQDAFGQSQSQQVSSPISAGTNNPWASNANQTEALKPMQTGSNNPFASQYARQQAQQQQQNQRPSQPTLSTLAEQRTAVQFNNNQSSSYNPITNFTAPQQPAPQQYPQATARPAQQELDPTRARLNALLASGEGMDTFGNTGEMRIPAQHTAPGTFVNSSGQNLNRLHATQTGNNPFFSQQFTGVPQQQFPAQTGPAGQFGSTGNNPFGQRQQPSSNSLIDL